MVTKFMKGYSYQNYTNIPLLSHHLVPITKWTVTSIATTSAIFFFCEGITLAMFSDCIAVFLAAICQVCEQMDLYSMPISR